ncbi:immunoglobulin-like and fibronectin type III domain-containing protein 1 isoform X1 [Paramormyrops kingsleyae]|uniref:immunoglobulin-like and fibronectin type III domain-containing protein 1 isoform X1 n=2 Tax=Paramormyrops kingsleyae TaxID=1676925 RepID=UPI003B97702F
MWRTGKTAATGQMMIRKRSTIPGVMINQYVEKLPEGKTTPDFIRKPTAITVNEGKVAVFRAAVIGDPAPTVTWGRSKDNVTDPEKYQKKYDDTNEEYVLEIPNVSVDQADVYKCFATNEFGKAICSATMKVIAVGGKNLTGQGKEMDFRKMLKRTNVEKKKPPAKKEGEIDPQFWEVLLSADRKDYERICAEYGYTDFRFILKKIAQMKKEREEEQAKYVESISNPKPIEVKGDGTAKFEFDMELKDPNSNLFLFKDGEMLDYGREDDDSDSYMKYNLKQSGKNYMFSIKDIVPEDAGLYQVDVEDTNVFSTELKLPSGEFLANIKEVKAEEGQDAIFECVLSNPLPSITWMGGDTRLDSGGKYHISVSEDQLIHRLVVKGCKPGDKGVYKAIAGSQSSSASLIVQGGSTTQGGGGSSGLDKTTQDQQTKLQKERGKMGDEKGAREKNASASGGAGGGIAGDGMGDSSAGLGSGSASAMGDGSGKDGKGLGDMGSRGNGSGGDDRGLSGRGTDGADTGLAGLTGSGVGGRRHDEDGLSGTRLDDDGLGGAGAGGAGLGGDASAVDGSGEDGADGKGKQRNRAGLALPETHKDPGVYFSSGLSDVHAIIGEAAEMFCKLSSGSSDGVWYKDGKKLKSTDRVKLTKDGATHKLCIKNCQEADSGKYRFEADGRKTEAMLNVQDPPRFSSDDLSQFSEPVVVRAGETATFKMPFVGREPMKVQWYKEGEELLDDRNVTVEKAANQSRLLLRKCQRKDSGEIKVKIRNEFGTTEAISKLKVLDKPTPPQGPVDVIESTSNCIHFKWRPPKDDGGSPLTTYILERQQVGRNTWKKLGEIPGGDATYRDTDVDHGRKYCYRIWAKSAEGVSEMMESDDIMAGAKAFPNAPAAPKVVSAFKNCITLQWAAPSNTGGGSILGYHLEKRKKGSNLWTPVNPADEPIQEKRYAVTEVVAGTEYEFRVMAVNISGFGEPSAPSESVMARDPKKLPGKVMGLKVTNSTYNSLSLAWNKPKVDSGVQDEAKGYFVEIRPADSTEWVRCNSNPITATFFTVIGLRSMAMYWVRAIATNEGGEGEPQQLDNYILAMPPPVRPTFKNTKGTKLTLVRAGNSARVNINYEASPLPEVTWLKDGFPIPKRVTVTNAEGASQLLIPSSERSDTGVYAIIVKNLVGQETFSVEIRVTDDPKPPGLLHLEEKVPGTVTVSWAPSPDENLDDRLHYTVSKHDSVKRRWHTVAQRLFNNKFTVVNIMAGREYRFRVYANNDMGVSEPSESPTWATKKKKDKFVLNVPKSKSCNFQTSPKFLVPLKMHSAPEGYECYMSCAVTGNPAPRITWYHDSVSLNTDADYHITNTCGVCSLLILRVGPKSSGEYKVMAENRLGRAESSTTLTVRGAFILPVSILCVLYL